MGGLAERGGLLIVCHGYDRVIDLTPEDTRAARDAAEREVGLQVAHFTTVLDGAYTHEVVLTGPVPVRTFGSLDEAMSATPDVVPFEVVPLATPRPRYRTAVDWRPAPD